MQEILKKVHVHMPFDLLPKYQDAILKEKMNLEIYFSPSVMDSMNEEACRQAAKLVARASVKVTFHASFMDLRPGALDEKIRRASIDRLKQVFELAPYFHPLRIVCHPSYDDRYYVSCDEMWLAKSAATWAEMTTLARDVGTIISLENVYEKDPHILGRLFERLNSKYVCFCFDAGHFNVFSRTPLSLWMQELGPYLGQLHLHDNNGKSDEHLPVGEGKFPFPELFQALREMKKSPVITLEAHAQDDLWQSLNNIKKNGYLDNM
jgi:sugar phosphate isomerase/epimerase